MKSNKPNGGSASKTCLPTGVKYKTASEIKHLHQQADRHIKKLVTDMSETIERHVYDALVHGTSVMYADREQTDDNHLYVCGDRKCNGIKPTASDPLAQYKCKFSEVHCRVKGEDIRPCYIPRMIDEHAAQEVGDDPEDWP
jgi:hypothetical protein